ncbi:MAG: 4-hydroxy-tetrahydrodipicolinate reductase, partial [Rhodoferax sp.]
MTQKIAVAGASGRMGQMLIDAIRVADDCSLAGALDMVGSAALGQDAGAAAGKPTGIVITSDLHAGLKPCDVLIDF